MSNWYLCQFLWGKTAEAWSCSCTTTPHTLSWHYHLKLEVLMRINLKITVFWDMTPYSLGDRPYTFNMECRGSFEHVGISVPGYTASSPTRPWCSVSQCLYAAVHGLAEPPPQPQLGRSPTGRPRFIDPVGRCCRTAVRTKLSAFAASPGRARPLGHRSQHTRCAFQPRKDQTFELIQNCRRVRALAASLSYS
jgi:hypothetical protein